MAGRFAGMVLPGFESQPTLYSTPTLPNMASYTTPTTTMSLSRDIPSNVSAPTYNKSLVSPYVAKYHTTRLGNNQTPQYGTWNGLNSNSFREYNQNVSTGHNNNNNTPRQSENGNVLIDRLPNSGNGKQSNINTGNRRLNNRGQGANNGGPVNTTSGNHTNNNGPSEMRSNQNQPSNGSRNANVAQPQPQRGWFGGLANSLTSRGKKVRNAAYGAIQTVGSYMPDGSMINAQNPGADYENNEPNNQNEDDDNTGGDEREQIESVPEHLQSDLHDYLDHLHSNATSEVFNATVYSFNRDLSDYKGYYNNTHHTNITPSQLSRFQHYDRVKEIQERSMWSNPTLFKLTDTVKDALIERYGLYKQKFDDVDWKQLSQDAIDVARENAEYMFNNYLIPFLSDVSEIYLDVYRAMVEPYEKLSAADREEVEKITKRLLQLTSNVEAAQLQYDQKRIERRVAFREFHKQLVEISRIYGEQTAAIYGDLATLVTEGNDYARQEVSRLLRSVTQELNKVAHRGVVSSKKSWKLVTQTAADLFRAQVQLMTPFIRLDPNLDTSNRDNIPVITQQLLWESERYNGQQHQQQVTSPREVTIASETPRTASGVNVANGPQSQQEQEQEREEPAQASAQPMNQVPSQPAGTIDSALTQLKDHVPPEVFNGSIHRLTEDVKLTEQGLEHGEGAEVQFAGHDVLLDLYQDQSWSQDTVAGLMNVFVQGVTRSYDGVKDGNNWSAKNWNRLSQTNQSDASQYSDEILSNYMVPFLTQVHTQYGTSLQNIHPRFSQLSINEAKNVQAGVDQLLQLAQLVEAGDDDDSKDQIANQINQLSTSYSSEQMSIILAQLPILATMQPYQSRAVVNLLEQLTSALMSGLDRKQLPGQVSAEDLTVEVFGAMDAIAQPFEYIDTPLDPNHYGEVFDSLTQLYQKTQQNHNRQGNNGNRSQNLAQASNNVPQNQTVAQSGLYVPVANNKSQDLNQAGTHSNTNANISNVINTISRSITTNQQSYNIVSTNSLKLVASRDTDVMLTAVYKAPVLSMQLSVAEYLAYCHRDVEALVAAVIPEITSQLADDAGRGLDQRRAMLLTLTQSIAAQNGLTNWLQYRLYTIQHPQSVDGALLTRLQDMETRVGSTGAALQQLFANPSHIDEKQLGVLQDTVAGYVRYVQDSLSRSTELTSLLDLSEADLQATIEYPVPTLGMLEGDLQPLYFPMYSDADDIVTTDVYHALASTSMWNDTVDQTRALVQYDMLKVKQQGKPLGQLRDAVARTLSALPDNTVARQSNGGRFEERLKNTLVEDHRVRHFYQTLAQPDVSPQIADKCYQLIQRVIGVSKQVDQILNATQQQGRGTFQVLLILLSLVVRKFLVAVPANKSNNPTTQANNGFVKQARSDNGNEAKKAQASNKAEFARNDQPSVKPVGNNISNHVKRSTTPAGNAVALANNQNNRTQQPWAVAYPQVVKRREVDGTNAAYMGPNKPVSPTAIQIAGPAPLAAYHQTPAGKLDNPREVDREASRERSVSRSRSKSKSTSAKSRKSQSVSYRRKRRTTSKDRSEPEETKEESVSRGKKTQYKQPLLHQIVKRVGDDAFTPTGHKRAVVVKYLSEDTVLVTPLLSSDPTQPSKSHGRARQDKYHVDDLRASTTTPKVTWAEIEPNL